MKPYPQSDEHLPGTWKALKTLLLGKKATFTCPNCKQVGTLIDHDIADDGTVTPSVVCDCGFHEWIYLVGWQPS